MINAIVTLATLLGGAVVSVWILYPVFRLSMEAPKYRLLEAEKRFDPANIGSTPPAQLITTIDSPEPSGGETSTQQETR